MRKFGGIATVPCSISRKKSTMQLFLIVRCHCMGRWHFVGLIWAEWYMPTMIFNSFAPSERERERKKEKKDKNKKKTDNFMLWKTLWWMLWINKKQSLWIVRACMIFIIQTGWEFDLAHHGKFDTVLNPKVKSLNTMASLPPPRKSPE